jgi:signal transduction histidine kinase
LTRSRHKSTRPSELEATGTGPAIRNANILTVRESQMNEKPHILIVDDDDNTRRTLRMIFGREGYETTEAASGREALAVAKRQPADLALLDVRLPDMLGVELLAPLKALDPDIVVMIVTGNASLDSAMQALNQGALAYFTKPLDMEALLARISEALERQRLVRENRRLYQEAQRELMERKRAEEALRKSKERLEATLAELSETQEQMLHQERLAAVGQLSAGIAHDFNTILASISLYTQMSLQMSELSPTIRTRLEVIAREANRAADLVQQILDFSRRAVLRQENLNLQPLLKETVALLERTLPESVRMDLAFGPGDYIINADSARVQQAIANLALNARDAMPDGGELHIAMSRVEDGEINCVDCGRVVGGDWVQVTVRDTGTGIAPEVLPHIFEPFFTTRAPLGHGLGLAQVYGIVMQHEGHLEVKTEVGRGTTFKLYWPALPVARPEAQAQIQPDAAQGNGQIILVVEDHAILRTALVDVMDMLGYRALEATNGREALAICEEHRDDISLVLSDWVMPAMGGLALVRELEKRNIAVNVLMLTGHPLDEQTRRALPESVVGWVLKPPVLAQLAEAVSQALAASESAASA